MCIHKINMEFIKHEKSGRCCKTKVYASMARKQGQLKMETIPKLGLHHFVLTVFIHFEPIWYKRLIWHDMFE